MSLENMVLSEGRQTEKPSRCGIRFSQNGPEETNPETGGGLVLVGGRGRGQTGRDCRWVRGSTRGGSSALRSVVVTVAQPGESTKSHRDVPFEWRGTTSVKS